MTRNISPKRKTAYYVGILITIVGVLLFGSTFVTFAMNFGNFENFAENARSNMFRAVGGMALMVAGGILCAIGARGLAGSGVVLDPKKAREDLEPYTRMAGGMLKDALDEADISLKKTPPEKVVMVKCPACGRLNEEDSKFCQECGGKL